ncbi:MAG: THUMP domain-containing protein [Candidatus Thorarchaeota archaeon]
MQEVQILKQYNLVLIRYGEIWLKSQKVKIRMLKTLMNNIKNVLARNNISFHKYQLSKDSSRIFFFFNNKDLHKAINILKNIFGIYSVSAALRTSSNIKNISERTIEVAKEILQMDDSFALRIKRSGKHDYSSLELAKIIGQKILDNFEELNLSVNLTNPKKKIYIEVRDDFCYIFSQIIKNNWGGLPVESSKRVIVMDVGRITDIIAGFLMMRRGCVIYPVLFKNVKDSSILKMWVSNWEKVREYFSLNSFKLLKVDLFYILEIINQKIQNKQYICGICRLIRLNILAELLKISNFVDLRKSVGIIDGITLNNSTLCSDEVDLQTISLNYIFSNYPVFTPNIGYDLQEITKIQNQISTQFQEYDYCRFKPKNQEFNDKELKEIYESMKIDDLVRKSIENIEEIKIV